MGQSEVEMGRDSRNDMEKEKKKKQLNHQFCCDLKTL